MYDTTYIITRSSTSGDPLPLKVPELHNNQIALTVSKSIKEDV